MIRDHLIPALKSNFTNREIIFDDPPRPIAVFHASEPAVGKVLIFDDGDEATVLIEKITHAHFNEYDKNLKEEERERRITENVVDFLKALFDDRVLLHVSQDSRAGGWQRLDLEEKSLKPKLSSSLNYYLWSRPYED